MEKIDLFRLRDVVRHDVFARLAEVTLGAEPENAWKSRIKMRLVEIAAVKSDPRPVRRLDVPHEFSSLLKPSHAAIQLRRQTDFGRKQLDKSPLAEAEAARHVVNPGCPARSIKRRRAQSIPRAWRCGAYRRRETSVSSSSENRRLNRGGSAEPLAQFGSRPTPQSFEIEVSCPPVRQPVR